MAARLPPFIKILKSRYPDKNIQNWYQDESRFGLKTRIAAKWSIKGSSPVEKKSLGFGYQYYIGSVNPASGDHRCLITDCCNTEALNIHLEDLNNSVNKNTLIVLVCDQAPWHKSLRLKKFDKIKLYYLPPYSPELNPIERLWLYLKSKYLSNIAIKDMKELKKLGIKIWQGLTNSIVMSVCKDYNLSAEGIR